MPQPLKTFSPRYLQYVYEDLCDRYHLDHNQIDLAALAQIVTVFTPAAAQAFNMEEMCEMAARYFIRISNLKPFANGNPKAALAACLAFLGWNDIQLDVEEMDLFQIVLDTYHQETSEEELAAFLFDHAKPPTPNALWTYEK